MWGLLNRSVHTCTRRAVSATARCGPHRRGPRRAEPGAVSTPSRRVVRFEPWRMACAPAHDLRGDHAPTIGLRRTSRARSLRIKSAVRESTSTSSDLLEEKRSCPIRRLHPSIHAPRRSRHERRARRPEGRGAYAFGQEDARGATEEDRRSVGGEEVLSIKAGAPNESRWASVRRSPPARAAEPPTSRATTPAPDPQ